MHYKKCERKERMIRIMKKVLSTILITLVAMLMLGTVSMATTEAELEEYVYSVHEIAGAKIKMRDTDKVKLEKFFKENDLTDEQATEIKGIVEKAIKVMNEDGASAPDKISTTAKKQELLGYAEQVASILGYTVSFDSTENRLDIYKNGTQVDSLYWGVYVDENGNQVATTEPSLAKTGSTNYLYVIGAGVVLIAGITFVIARKKANA
jgi:LPXTG-motif cell wall-anchored protein